MESLLCSQLLWWPHSSIAIPPTGQERIQGPQATVSRVSPMSFHLPERAGEVSPCSTATTPWKSWDAHCQSADSSSREV